MSNFASNYEKHLKNIKAFRLFQKEKKRQEVIEKIAMEKKQKDEHETQPQDKAKQLKDRNISKVQ